MYCNLWQCSQKLATKINHLQLIRIYKENKLSCGLLTRVNVAVMSLYPQLMRVHFVPPGPLYRWTFTVQVDRGDFTPHETSQGCTQCIIKNPSSTAGKCRGGVRISHRQKKQDIAPPWRICIKFNAMKHDFWGGELPVKKSLRCLQCELCSRSLLFIAEIGEYSESVSWWHFAMCSAEGEKAAEGSRIYWLNFTVINGSFTSDIKKMICSAPRRWRSVNLFCVLPAVMAVVLNKVSFNRL